MERFLGALGEAEQMVDDSLTASAVKSGALRVFSTPSLVALMECAACNALSLPDGQTSVGTRIDVKHTSATPVGVRVTARAEVISVSERTIAFHITASDNKGSIGEADHTRAIVDAERLMKKAEAKAQT